MSPIALAETIDRLVEANRALVTEAAATATVSALSAADAVDLLRHCQQLGWVANLFDSDGAPWSEAEPPHQDFAPFRLTIDKPIPPDDTLLLLSNKEFASWLKRGHNASHWQVARLIGPIVTWSKVFQPWGATQVTLNSSPTKSPRALVREFGNERRVPEDIRPWLAQSLDEVLFATPTVQVWVGIASAALARSLPDEIDSVDGALKFRGPPRLTIPSPTATNAAWDLSTFSALQSAAIWVFENEREAEMRHILLAAELARSGPTAESAADFLRTHLAQAFEGAQIAYQMALAETSRDTLKVLGDLRKAVTDETAKLSDLSRQLAASIAGALATGIGLVAARVAANAPAALVGSVMVVVMLYVLMVIVSGVQFVRLQKRLRRDWQPRLYRFLPTREYKELVTVPAAKAERSFYLSAVLGVIVVLVLAAACAWSLWGVVPHSNQTARPASSTSLESRGSSKAVHVAPIAPARSVNQAEPRTDKSR